VWVLPAGITGSDAMFPIGEDGLHQVTAVVTIGPPVEARALHDEAHGDRRLMMDAVGQKIAELLPCEYRGAYS
jgi:1-acyl-sn-glycerol-3-phosphate acyltransferase